MRILITGGAGYIGTELANRLSNSSEVEKIVVYDNLSRGNFNFFTGEQYQKNKIDFVHGELLDSRKLKKALDGIDAVYHLAAKVTTPFSNLDGHVYEQVNHWGTSELVTVLETSKVTQLIFLSSTSVYGNTREPATEETAVNPDSFYSISKYRAEKHISRTFGAMKTAIIRLGNVYGYSRSMRFDAAINRLMFDAHFTGRITINGSGHQRRSFIHVQTAVNALSDLLGLDIPNGVYNLSSNDNSILEIASALRQLYPELELFFINQHYPVRDSIVEKKSRLLDYVSIAPPDLISELEDFRRKFSFSSR